jgi:hypothetical protein
VISGDGEIVGNKIEVDGNVATTICHPPEYELGSHIATFDLVGARTLTYYEVGVGHPITSTWRVEFLPLEKDTINARILVRVYGSEGWREQAVPWPSTEGVSNDRVTAQVCYEPGALLRGGIGVIPQVDNNINLAGWEDNCYTVSGQSVGNWQHRNGTDSSGRAVAFVEFDQPVEEGADLVARGRGKLGAGGLMTLAHALIGESVPPRERGKFQAWIAGAYGFASAFGPVAGGFITQAFGWRWVFWFLLPLPLVCAYIARRLPDIVPDHAGRRWRFDWLGLVLFVLTMGAALVALDRVVKAQKLLENTL